MHPLQDLLGLDTKLKEPLVEVWKVEKEKFDLDAWRQRITDHAIAQTKVNNGTVAPEFHFYTPHNVTSQDHVTVGLVKIYFFRNDPIMATVVGQALPSFVEQLGVEAIVIVTGAQTGTVDVDGDTNEEMMADALEKVEAGSALMTPCLFLHFETAQEFQVTGYEIAVEDDEVSFLPIPNDQIPMEVPHLLYEGQTDEN